MTSAFSCFRQLPGWAVLADVAIGQLWKFRHVSDGAEQVVAAGCLADLFVFWSEAPARQTKSSEAARLATIFSPFLTASVSTREHS